MTSWLNWIVVNTNIGLLSISLPICPAFCVAECWIRNQEVVGSNPVRGCSVPMPTQCAIPPGSVTEYQRKLRSKRAYHAMCKARICTVVLQLQPMSGWKPMKRKSAPLYGPMMFGNDGEGLYIMYFYYHCRWCRLSWLRLNVYIFVCALRYRLACKMWALGAPLPPLARGGVDHGLALVGHPTKFCSSVQNYFCLKIAGDSKVEMFLRYVNTFGPGYTGWNRPLNRVGIVGGWGWTPPTVHVYTRSFWVKIGFKFQSLGKISNISTSNSPVLLGQFLHCL